MGHRGLARLTSFLTLAVVTIVGVVLLFRAIAERDESGASWHPLLAIAVYLTLSIALFDWAAHRTQSASVAAAVIAGAQGILIVDLLARGERGPLTAAIGVVLVAASWAAVAAVYSWCMRRGSTG